MVASFLGDCGVRDDGHDEVVVLVGAVDHVNPRHTIGRNLANGKYGQFSVVMQEKGAVLAITSDCETPHETLKAFWETAYPEL